VEEQFACTLRSIGTGYVGLVVDAGPAETGNGVSAPTSMTARSSRKVPGSSVATLSIPVGWGGKPMMWHGAAGVEDSPGPTGGDLTRRSPVTSPSARLFPSRVDCHNTGAREDASVAKRDTKQPLR